jgi:hypothetical protein
MIERDQIPELQDDDRGPIFHRKRGAARRVVLYRFKLRQSPTLLDKIRIFALGMAAGAILARIFS